MNLKWINKFQISTNTSAFIHPLLQPPTKIVGKVENERLDFKNI